MNFHKASIKRLPLKKLNLPKGEMRSCRLFRLMYAILGLPPTQELIRKTSLTFHRLVFNLSCYRRKPVMTVKRANILVHVNLCELLAKENKFVKNYLQLQLKPIQCNNGQFLISNKVQGADIAMHSYFVKSMINIWRCSIVILKLVFK